jgi:hypothetical protein
MPDSPDSAIRQHDNTPLVGQVRSFENLVDPTRYVRFLGVAHVDDPSAISQRLAEEVTKKAFKLIVSVVQLNEDRESKRYECQANLIREGTLDDYMVRPVTAKHNIATGEVGEGVEKVVEEYRASVLRIPRTGIQKDIEVVFPDGGCTYDDHDECDIAWGEQVRNRSLVLHTVSFRRVRPEFRCTIGQKVAIVIYSENGATPEAAAAPAGYTQEDMERIYGQKKHINILTGEITLVGTDRICYSINTFGGCSGAVVFLLDAGQPDSVLHLKTKEGQSQFTVDLIRTRAYPAILASCCLHRTSSSLRSMQNLMK